jgi:hypothetical protein
MQLKTNTKYWGNDADKRKPKYSENTLSQCHFVQYKSDGLAQDRACASEALNTLRHDPAFFGD